MADCTRCGRKLPVFSFGAASNICKECRAAMAHFAEVQGDTVARRLEDSQPTITTGILAINLIVFLAMVFSGVSVTNPKTMDLLRWGANYGPWSLGPQPWRLLTAVFVHIGIIHIALNMWCLWNLGSLAERIFDKFTYVLIYLACGLAASIVSVGWSFQVPNAGASGAIFGIAGALISALYLGKLPVSKQAMQGTLKSLLTFAGYNLFFGAAVSGISNSAHIGGLVAGLLMGAAIAPSLTASNSTRRVWGLGVFLAAALACYGGFVFLNHKYSYVIALAQNSQSLSSGRIDDAIRQLEATTAKNPKDHDSLVLLGEAYARKQDYQKAVLAFEKALAVNPESIDALYDLGYADMKLGRNQQAVDALEKAAKLDPTDADIQETLAEAYHAAGNESASQAAAQKALALKAAPKSDQKP